MSNVSEIIYDIKVTGQSELDKLNETLLSQQDKLKKTQKEIKGYEEELKELAKETGDTSQKEAELNEKLNKSRISLLDQREEIKKTNKGRREAQKVVDSYNKVIENEIGSNEELKGQLFLLTKRYNAMSKEQRDNTKEGRQLQSNIKGITDQLKTNESAIGDNRRNVGNYTESIQQAIGGMGGLTGEIGQNVSSFANMSKVLMANPFMLIVTLLGQLINAFGDTQEGMDALRKITEPLNFAMERVLGFLQELSLFIFENLTDAFNNPIESIKELGDLLLQNLLNRPKGIGKFIQGYVKYITNLFKAMGLGVKKALADVPIIGRNIDVEQVQKDMDEAKREVIQGAKDMANGAGQALTGIEDPIDKFKDAIDLLTPSIYDLLNSFKQGLKDGDEFSEMQKNLEISTRDSIRPLASLRRQIEENRRAVEDANLTEEERIELFEETNKLIQQKADIERNLLDQEIAMLQLKQAQNATSVQEEIQLERLLARRDDLVAQTEKELKQQDRRLKTLLKNNDEEVETEFEKQQRLLKEREKAIERELVQEELRMLKLLDMEEGDEEKRQQIIQQSEEKKAEIRKQFLDEQIRDIETALDPLLAEAEGEGALAFSLGLTEEQRAKMEAELLQLKQSLNELTPPKEEEGETPEDEDAPRTLLDMLGLDEEGMEKLFFAFDAVKSGLQSIGNLMNEITNRNIRMIEDQVKAGVKSQEEADKEIEKIEKKAFRRNKAIQIATATANTAQAVISALAQTIDFTPTQSLRQANAITAGILGGIEIATIKAQKFAQGGHVKGKGTATSDSIPAMLSNGEYVINAGAVKTFGTGVFDALNNFQVPQFFSTGGLVTPSPPRSNNEALSEVTERIESQDFRVINVESDFTGTQNRVRNVERATTF